MFTVLALLAATSTTTTTWTFPRPPCRMTPSTFTAVGLDSSDSNGLAAWDDNEEEEDKGPVFMPARNHSYLDLATLPVFLLPRKLLCAPIIRPTTTTVPPLPLSIIISVHQHQHHQFRQPPNRRPSNGSNMIHSWESWRDLPPNDCTWQIAMRRQTIH